MDDGFSRHAFTSRVFPEQGNIHFTDTGSCIIFALLNKPRAMNQEINRSCGRKLSAVFFTCSSCVTSINKKLQLIPKFRFLSAPAGSVHLPAGSYYFTAQFKPFCQFHIPARGRPCNQSTLSYFSLCIFRFL